MTRNIFFSLLGALLCAPLAASSSTVPLQFSNGPSKDVFAVSDMRRNVFEYLIYRDYFLGIRRCSKAWQLGMDFALNPNTNNPLLLPEADELVDHVKYLLASIDHAKDPAGLSVVKRLAILCQRSHNPYITIWQVIHCGYKQNVPEAQHIFSSLHEESVFATVDSKFVALCVDLPVINGKLDVPAIRADAAAVGELEKEHAKKLKELSPFLKEWQPYGVLLKMYGRLGYGFNVIEELKQWGVGAVNLIRAPQIMVRALDDNGNEIYVPQLVVQADTIPFIRSDLCWLQVSHDLYNRQWDTTVDAELERIKKNIYTQHDKLQCSFSARGSEIKKVEWQLRNAFKQRLASLRKKIALLGSVEWPCQDLKQFDKWREVHECHDRIFTAYKMFRALIAS